MSNAVKCPVCMGAGILYEYPNDNTSSGTHNNTRMCHGCKGVGWVVVP